MACCAISSRDPVGLVFCRLGLYGAGSYHQGSWFSALATVVAVGGVQLAKGLVARELALANSIGAGCYAGRNCALVGSHGADGSNICQPGTPGIYEQYSV